jgi:hypothetical protein
VDPREFVCTPCLEMGFYRLLRRSEVMEYTRTIAVEDGQLRDERGYICKQCQAPSGHSAKGRGLRLSGGTGSSGSRNPDPAGLTIYPYEEA